MIRRVDKKTNKQNGEYVFLKRNLPFAALGIYFLCHLSELWKTLFTFLFSKDFLRITDGLGKILGLYCGNETGQRLLVTGDKVGMTFRSDDKVEKRGYYLVFTLVSSSLPVSHGKRDHKEPDYAYLVNQLAYLLLKFPK